MRRVFNISSLVSFISVSVLIMMIMTCNTAEAQVNPPRPLTLTTQSLQSLNFGPFAITGSGGGTVTVSNSGGRTQSGDVMLVGSGWAYGIFTVEAPVGTSLYLMNSPTATLTGSNGGSMTMTLGQTYPVLPFVSTSAVTEFHVGGTLTVGTAAQNPPGSYSGYYEIIINHE